METEKSKIVPWVPTRMRKAKPHANLVCQITLLILQDKRHVARPVKLERIHYLDPHLVSNVNPGVLDLVVQWNVYMVPSVKRETRHVENVFLVHIMT